MSLSVVKTYDSVDEFEFWSGAYNNLKELSEDQKEEIWKHLESIFSNRNNVTETEINDEVWHNIDELCISCFGVNYDILTRYANGSTDFGEVINDEIKPEVVDKVLGILSVSDSNLDAGFIYRLLRDVYHGLPISVVIEEPQTEGEEYNLSIVIQFSKDHILEIDVYGATIDELKENLESEL